MHHRKFNFKIFWVFIILCPIPVFSATDFSRKIEVVGIENRAKLTGTIWVDGCHGFDLQGKPVKSMKGYLCQPIPGKGYLSVTGDFNSPEFSFFDLKGAKKWSLNIPVHHQVSYRDGKIYLLTHEIKTLGKKKIKYDKFLVISEAGKILDEWTSEAMVKSNKLLDGGFLLQHQNKIEGGYFEFTHINSFLVKEENPNQILLSLSKNSAILEVDLLSKKEKIVKKFSEISGIHSLHWDGKSILFFANQIKSKKMASGVVKMRQVDGVIEQVWSQFGGEDFFSKTRGSLQKIDDDLLLISFGSGEFLFFSRSQSKILYKAKVTISDARESYLRKIYDLRYEK